MRKYRFFPALIYVFGMTGIFILLFFGVACKKEDDSMNPAQRTEQLSQLWQMNSVLVNGQPYSGTEYNNWQFDFRKDGTYTFSNGSTSEPGTWELNSNNNKLLLDKGTSSEVLFTILQLDRDNLEVESSQTSTKTGETKIAFLLKPAKK
jgi:hypothetical protein